MFQVKILLLWKRGIQKVCPRKGKKCKRKHAYV